MIDSPVSEPLPYPTMTIRDKILSAALDIAQSQGFDAVRRGRVADAVGVSTGTVSGHWGDMSALRDEVMRLAVERELLAIVADGLLERNTVALAAPENIRFKAMMERSTT